MKIITPTPIEKLKLIQGYENISEVEAKAIINSLKALANACYAIYHNNLKPDLTRHSNENFENSGSYKAAA